MFRWNFFISLFPLFKVTGCVEWTEDKDSKTGETIQVITIDFYSVIIAQESSVDSH